MTSCRLLAVNVYAMMYAIFIDSCYSWAVMPDIGTGAALESAAFTKRSNSALNASMYALNTYLNWGHYDMVPL